MAAANASIGSGGSVATDAGGNVYIRSFQCVLKVDPNGILTLVAGNGSVALVNSDLADAVRVAHSDRRVIGIARVHSGCFPNASGIAVAA